MHTSLRSGLPVPPSNDRRQDVRFIGNVAGCYTLSTADGIVRGSDVQIFACRITSISPRMAVLSAPFSGQVGELVAANFDHFRTLHGHIARVLPGGFAFDIDASAEERLKLAAKIEWLKQKVFHAVEDKRAYKRVLPRTTRTSLLLANNAVIPGFIIDLSCSGVAVSADLAPSVGTVVAVGKVPGRVVRRLNVGFAIQFAEVQSMAFLEQMLTTAHNGPIADLLPHLTEKPQPD